jgi:hypothetical protein
MKSSMISFAKVIEQTRKTYGNFRSRMGLVLWKRKALVVPSFEYLVLNSERIDKKRT